MRHSLIIFIGFAMLQSCNSQPATQKLVEASMIRTSLRAMDFIKSRDYENFNFLIPKELKNIFPADKLKIAIDYASDIVNKEGIPTGDLVQSRISYQLNGHDTIYIKTIAFLYNKNNNNQNSHDEEITFSFIERFGDKKIISFNVNTDPQNSQNLELKISAVDKLNFNVNNVTKYRIYYSEGTPARTLFGKNKGVFALEGNSQTFKSSGLTEIFKNIFAELEKCKLQNPERFTTALNYSGNTQFIQAEFAFEQLDYGIFIYLPINGPGIKNDKIIIRQLQFANLGYQYYVDQNENQKLVALLKTISTKNWGSNYVDNP